MSMPGSSSGGSSSPAAHPSGKRARVPTSRYAPPERGTSSSEPLVPGSCTGTNSSDSTGPSNSSGALPAVAALPAFAAPAPNVLSENETKLISCCICLNVVPKSDLFLHAAPRDSERHAGKMCNAITCTDCSFSMWREKTRGQKSATILNCPICKETLFYNESGRTDRRYQKLLANFLEGRDLNVTCAGCDYDVSYASYGTHLETCQEALSACPFGCSTKYKFGKLRAHYANCGARILCKCPRCPEMVSQIRMGEHMGNGHGKVVHGVLTTSEPVAVDIGTPMQGNNDIYMFYELEGIKFCVSIWCGLDNLKAAVACVGGYPADPQTYQVTAAIRFTNTSGTAKRFEVTSCITACRVVTPDKRYMGLCGRSPQYEEYGPHTYEFSLSLQRVEGPARRRLPARATW